MSADGRLFNENRILAEQVRGLKAELERKGHEVLQLRERAAAAREEGRREGLEEAEAAVSAKALPPFLDQLNASAATNYRAGVETAAAAIRALKEKQG